MMVTQIIDKELWDEFELELAKAKEVKVTINSPSNSASDEQLKRFFDKFLLENFPEGKINKILEKNFAVWIVRNNVNLESIKEIYKRQGWNIGGLLGWIKKVNSGEIKEINFGELMNWAKEYNSYKQDLIGLGQIADVPMILDVVKNDKINILNYAQVFNFVEVERQWLTEKLINSQSVIVLAGKRSTLKSWVSLNIAHAIALGQRLFDNFECTQGNVLYVDRENGFAELKKRIRMIHKGLELGDKVDLPLEFISECSLKIDNTFDAGLLEVTIKERKAKLVIIDTYRRLISFDENDAREVSKFFIDIIKPIAERNNCAFLLIHHEKKGESQGDDMDMLRGSSDLANFVDGVIQIERKGLHIVLKQTKSRGAMELSPFSLKVDTDEQTYHKFIYEGEAGAMSREDKCTEELLIWINNERLREFQTSDAKDIAFEKGYKKQNFFNALNRLCNAGKIVSIGKGRYKVEDQERLNEL